jgi:hypothetical protein
MEMGMGMKESGRLLRVDTIRTELCDIFVLELGRVFRLINGELGDVNWLLNDAE